MAGDLWIDPIRLAARIKKAQKGRDCACEYDDRKVLNDCKDSGEQVMGAAQTLFSCCEGYMWKNMEEYELRNDSGKQFVETMFGSHRELPETDRLMWRLRNWINDFNRRAQPILEMSQEPKAPAPSTSSSSRSQTFASSQKAPSKTAPGLGKPRKPNTW